jgi:hypothetical protein
MSAVTTVAGRGGRRALAALVVAVLYGAAASGPAGAEPSGGPNHVVLASATADASPVTNSGLQVASVGSPTVTSDNIAQATSTNCTGCRAAAAAFQAVFITRDAHTITPGNVAAAANANCTNCDSFAFAYQYVLTTPGPVYLSADARQQISLIRQQVSAAINTPGLSDDQLETQLRDLASQFKSVIDSDLQQAGNPAQGTVDERADIAPAAG